MNVYGLYIKATYNYACILLNLVSSLRVFPAIYSAYYALYLFCFWKSTLESNITFAHPIAIFLSYTRLRNSPAFSYSNSLPIDRYYNYPLTKIQAFSIRDLYYKINGRYLGSHRIPNNTFFPGFPHTLRLWFPIPLWCIASSIFPAYSVFIIYFN